MIDGWGIRRARPADFDPLVALWQRSVRATHDFLPERTFVSLRPLVEETLREVAATTLTARAPCRWRRRR
jgi:putative acetyltransferase